MLTRKNDNEALRQAHQALASKNEQMSKMEKTIRELNQNISNSRIERTKTIEAHQSRIKQLQDKFLEDLKTAGKDQAYEVEVTLRKELSKDKEEALLSLRNNLEKEYSESTKLMQREMESLRAKFRALKDKNEKTNSEEAQQRERETQLLISDLKRDHAAEVAILNQRIRDLQLKLEETKQKMDPQAMKIEDRLSRMQNLLQKKDHEIAFLKDTVRVECEERMGLVAELTRLQNQLAQAGRLHDSLPNQSNSRPGSSRKPVATSSEKKESLSAKDESLFKLFQIASQKNEKRLGRLSRKAI
jgi:predicted  nucleic acid-binding Zn-ribbon protein